MRLCFVAVLLLPALWSRACIATLRVPSAVVDDLFVNRLFHCLCIDVNYLCNSHIHPPVYSGI